MSQQSPRRPTNLPAGTTSLSDRIAALQKKNSTNGNGSTSSRSTSANPSTIGGPTASSSLSPGPGPSRSISAGSQAVKDRIARFQKSDRPLLPKSSLGTPSPMETGRQSNAVRAYPGANASGSGSGNWGENVLRPQLTGGTWVGAGEGKGWAEAGSVRPQLTGSAWLGVGGSPSPSHSSRLGGVYPPAARSPIRQRDAFLDLDDEARLSASPQKRDPLRRGSSFTEAQMAAASAGLSRASSKDGSERGQSPVNEKKEATVQPSMPLPTLPDTPNKILPVTPSQDTRQAAPNGTDSVTEPVRTLPSPPSMAPVTIATSPPRDVRTNGDIEIGIGNASPAKMRDIQRTLSGSHDYAAPTHEKIAGPIPTAPILQEVVPSEPAEALTSTRQVAASSDDGAYDIGRLATKSDSDETEAPSSGPISAPDPSTRTADLPAITIAPQSPSVVQQEVMMLTDSIAPSDRGGGEAANGLLTNSVPAVQSLSLASGDTGNLEGGNMVEPAPLPEEEADISAVNGVLESSGSSAVDGVKGSSEQSGEVIANGAAANSDGTLTAANSMTTVAPSTSGGDVNAISEAQRRAKEAISIARSKSQRVRKPPIGRPMTVAEMEASDDEYEPGWASVISTFSNRT